MRRVNRNAEAERRIQDRIESVIARKHERRLRSVLGAMYSDAAAAYEDGSPTDGVVRSHDGRVEKVLTAIWEDSFRQLSSRVADQISQAAGKSAPPETKRMSDSMRRALDNFILRWAARKVTQVTSTTMTQIAQIVKRGVEDGLSVTEVAGEIIKTGKVYSAYRAAMISRTETHSAAQYGSLQAAEDSGVVEMKEWIPVEDGRTRDNVDFDHTNVDTVPVKEPFNVSGEALMHPGDPAGSAGNVINCRCAMGYLLIEE